MFGPRFCAGLSMGSVEWGYADGESAQRSLSSHIEHAALASEERQKRALAPEYSLGHSGLSVRVFRSPVPRHVSAKPATTTKRR